MSTRVTWIVGFLSVALLGFELSLMRILSYAQWYHFASMVISVALLGFGASGMVLALLRRRFRGHSRTPFFAATFLCVLFLALSPVLLSLISIDPFLLMWNLSNLWQLFLFYLIAFLPFFFGATVIGISFMMYPEQIGRIYFSNLLGSGIGSLAAVLLMQWVHPNELPIIMALAGVPALFFMFNRSRVRLTLAAGLLLLLGVLMVLPVPALKMSQYKALAKTLLLPEARIVQRTATPLGIVEVVESPALRYAPGMSLSYQGIVPAQPGVFSDGEWIGSILNADDSSALRVLEHSTGALPFRLSRPESVLVVGSGTGSDLHLALRYGARSVIGIEMNGGLVKLLGSTYRSVPRDSMDGNAVVVVGEARSYLSRHSNRFHLIVIPILEGQTASAAGMHAMFENYLFTVESFTLMLEHLKPEGMLVQNSWSTFPPRGALKIIPMLFEALKRIGIRNPQDHLVAIRSWGTVTVVVAREPFNEDQVQAVRSFADELGFDLVHVPGIREDEANRYHQMKRPYLYEAVQALIQGKGEEFAERYPFDISPTTDNRPYFSHFFKWRSLPELLDTYGRGEIRFFELGYFFLLITIIQLLVLSFILILLPIIFLRREQPAKGLLWRTVSYFGGIGIGYMFVEMVMIQKFILFLGHPIYSVSVIIATLLVTSGLGSYLSGMFQEHPLQNLRRAVGALILLLLLYAAVLPLLLPTVLAIEFTGRVAVCVLLLTPLGLLMGFPFPLGLTSVARLSQPLIPWAWGMNGFCSVMSVSLAVLIATEGGFRVLTLLAAAAYAVAVFCVPGGGRRAS